MRTKKVISLMVALVFVFSMSFAACTSGGSGSAPADTPSTAPTETAPAAPEPTENTGEVYTVRIGCATVLPSHPNQFMEELKASLESKSDQFVVELYPANQLGTNPEMIQGLQNGNVQGVVLPSGLFTSIAPIFNLLAVPGLVPGATVQYEMLNNSDVGVELSAEVSKSGVTPVAYLWCPSQEFYLNKDVTEMAGLKGLNIRGTDAKVMQDQLTAYGATPVVMSSGDVAMGLQQGTLDGLFTDCTFVAPLKLYEKAPHIISELPGVPNSNTVMISNLFLDSLPDDLKAIFLESVKECRESVKTYTEGYAQDCYDLIVENGGTIHQPSEAFIKELRDKDLGTQETFKKDNPDWADLYAKIESWVAANA